MKFKVRHQPHGGQGKYVEEGVPFCTNETKSDIFGLHAIQYMWQSIKTTHRLHSDTWWWHQHAVVMRVFSSAGTGKSSQS